MPIYLSSIEQIPKDFLKKLQLYHPLFTQCESIDQIFEDTELCHIICDLDAICRSNGVVGYHYTRCFPQKIQLEGLEICTGEEHRQKFLLENKDLFTETQRNWIVNTWRTFFSKSQNQARDNRVWFNMTQCALKNGRANYLLNFYGGESIYFPLIKNKNISAILHNVGMPMIVSCALDPKKLSTFTELPWGKIWVSTYHLIVNPNAYQFDIDAYQNTSIPSEQLINIESCSLSISVNNRISS